MNPATIVVDTNILFSLLLRGESALRKRFLTDSASKFHSPRFVFVELFQHKERIAQATEFSEEVCWNVSMSFLPVSNSLRKEVSRSALGWRLVACAATWTRRIRPSSP